MHPDPLSADVYGTYPTATFWKVFQIFMLSELLPTDDTVPIPMRRYERFLHYLCALHLISCYLGATVEICLLPRMLSLSASQPMSYLAAQPQKNSKRRSQFGSSRIHPCYAGWLAESSLRRLVITYHTVVLCTASLLILCDCSIYNFLYLPPVFLSHYLFMNSTALSINQYHTNCTTVLINLLYRTVLSQFNLEFNNQSNRPVP
jgi:hypothetical protein